MPPPRHQGPTARAAPTTARWRSADHIRANTSAATAGNCRGGNWPPGRTHAATIRPLRTAAPTRRTTPIPIATPWSLASPAEADRPRCAQPPFVDAHCKAPYYRSPGTTIGRNHDPDDVPGSWVSRSSVSAPAISLNTWGRSAALLTSKYVLVGSEAQPRMTARASSETSIPSVRVNSVMLLGSALMLAHNWAP